MVEIFRSRAARIWLSALYSLAVIVVGLAHRMPEASTTSVPVAAAYQLPGGLVPDLCTTDPGLGGGHTGDRDCDACRIADAPGLGAPDALSIPLPAGSASVSTALVVTIVVTTCRYRPPSRGPPSTAVSI